MTAERSVLPGRFSGLSIKLIATIMAVILLVEIVVYLPSLANYRASWLDDRLRVGVVAARVLDAVPDVMALPRNLTDRLLTSAGANAIVYRREGQSQLIELANPITPDVVVTADMRQRDLPSLIMGALDTLFAGPGRTLRIVGEGDLNESAVEILMSERPLRQEMLAYSRQIGFVSLSIAAITAVALYLLASYLFIYPVRRLTQNILAFRQAPENASLVITPSARRDEIGIVERELAAMESDLFTMLRHRRHLADLGLAVAKINHDLRNTLTSAQLLSDQVATLDDPKVQRLAPRLVTTLDRAIGFAQSVLDYGRETTALPVMAPVAMRALIDDAAFDARLMGHPSIRFSDTTPDDLVLEADASQLGRVFLNLLKNAREALELAPAGEVSPEVSVTMQAEGDSITFTIADNGPGLPPRAKDNLFVAFEGSARAGGTGLGLAIAREITEAHGGRLVYVDQPRGTRFDLILPANLRVEA
ncbi:MAG: HAMP domain-containing sensor histidine kinase [Candidatus Devosia phytovorans]|uniref:histidine kinase n=1 Tax=Candidatus Devosia phytovorans TaxID=3121372 RepID=A0AAJ5VRW5_9HYPH|nr:HAMP domain-containing sensor histidine kinase [Devosia sp.]WEK03671.1 MAG: HAMP domain-containing sensor histidine kinase [Devosia sp.]